MSRVSAGALGLLLQVATIAISDFMVYALAMKLWNAIESLITSYATTT